MKDQFGTKYNNRHSSNAGLNGITPYIGGLTPWDVESADNSIVLQGKVHVTYHKSENRPGRSAGKRILQPVITAVLVLFFAFCSETLALSSDDYRQLLQRGVEAGMDTERLETVITRARDRQIEPEQLDVLVTPAISLAEADLPYHSVLQKAMEGMAKRVPVENIQHVLNRMTEGLNRSAVIIDDWMQQEQVRSSVTLARGDMEEQAVARQIRDQLLENTSYALQQDVSEDAVRKLLNHVISENVIEHSGLMPVASAVRAFPDLPTSREDPATSNRILVRALKAGFTAGEIQQLPEAFRSAQFRSEMPAEHIARGMDRQMGAGVPSEHILKNLFQGNVRGGPPGFAAPGVGGNGDDGRDRGRRPDDPPDGPPNGPPHGPPDAP